MEPAKKTGRRYLAGSVLATEQPSKPPQEPSVPVQQLAPTHGDVQNAKESLGLLHRTKYNRRKFHEGASLLQRCGLTRPQVLPLLDNRARSCGCYRADLMRGNQKAMKTMVAQNSAA